MYVLQIEHSVKDFAAWKRTFDSDPAKREHSGVRRYRIMRPDNDPNFAIIELEFEMHGEATAMLSSLLGIWGRVTGTLIESPKARIVEVVENKEFVTT